MSVILRGFRSPTCTNFILHSRIHGIVSFIFIIYSIVLYCISINVLLCYVFYFTTIKRYNNSAVWPQLRTKAAAIRARAQAPHYGVLDKKCKWNKCVKIYCLYLQPGHGRLEKSTYSQIYWLIWHFGGMYLFLSTIATR